MRVSRDEGKTWGVRSPLTLAISRDEGKTWIGRRKLEDDPKGWYCYFAVLEKDDELLLGYGAEGVQLNHSRLTRVPLAWLSATERDGTRRCEKRE